MWWVQDGGPMFAKGTVGTAVGTVFAVIGVVFGFDNCIHGFCPPGFQGSGS